MAAGLQVWDESGVLILDTSQNVPRYVGFAKSSGFSGSITHSAVSGGKCTVMVICEATGTIGNGIPFSYKLAPKDLKVTQSGNTCSYTAVKPDEWNFSASFFTYATYFVQ